MNIKLTDTVLRCPTCDGDYLHHEMVEVFNCGEDRPHDRISITTCDEFNSDNKYELSIDQKGRNPSPRRSGMRVTFSCENCDNLSKLVIYQHKGQTSMDWEQ